VYSGELDMIELGIGERGWALGCGNLGQKGGEIRPERGLIFVTAGAPGRGVLRFLTGAYRNPVHNLGFFAFFSQN